VWHPHIWPPSCNISIAVAGSAFAYAAEAYEAAGELGEPGDVTASMMARHAEALGVLPVADAPSQ